MHWGGYGLGEPYYRSYFRSDWKEFAKHRLAFAGAADVMGVSSEDDAQALVNEVRYRKVKFFSNTLLFAEIQLFAVRAQAIKVIASVKRSG